MRLCVRLCVRLCRVLHGSITLGSNDSEGGAVFGSYQYVGVAAHSSVVIAFRVAVGGEVEIAARAHEAVDDALVGMAIAIGCSARRHGHGWVECVHPVLVRGVGAPVVVHVVDIYLPNTTHDRALHVVVRVPPGASLIVPVQIPRRDIPEVPKRHQQTDTIVVLRGGEILLHMVAGHGSPAVLLIRPLSVHRDDLYKRILIGGRDLRGGAQLSRLSNVIDGPIGRIRRVAQPCRRGTAVRSRIVPLDLLRAVINVTHAILVVVDPQTSIPVHNTTELNPLLLNQPPESAVPGIPDMVEMNVRQHPDIYPGATCNGANFGSNEFSTLTRVPVGLGNVN
mmetsp:Transcript_15155/g.43095  ORF Transcript_15155/g.43095 Transcript_15155/m.43095 type:complete len:337 (+) Transcript_15155:361-1371(+)